MTKQEPGNSLGTHRTIFSFWPLLLWVIPFAVVYSLEYWGVGHLCGRRINELIAMPLVLVSVFGYGFLAWRRRNEFSLVMFVLASGFFCREWHFVGTSKGVYVVAAFVGGWFVYRRKQMAALIKNTPVEIWLWATFLCYAMSILISRRIFAERHLGWLPMEELYHISLEETMETMAHLMLAFTCLVAWRQFGAGKKNTKEIAAEILTVE